MTVGQDYGLLGMLIAKRIFKSNPLYKYEKDGFLKYLVDNAQDYFPPLDEIYDCVKKNNQSNDLIIYKIILDKNESTKYRDEEFVSTSKKFYKVLGQDTLE